MGPMKKKRPPEQVTSRVGRLKFHCIIQRYPVNSRIHTAALMTHIRLYKLIRYRSNESTVKLSSEKQEKAFQREISRHFNNPGTLYGE